MDLGTMLYNNLKDVTWSTTALPLDQLVSAYRLPQIVKLDHGEQVEGLRDNDYLLIHSCRQWTTITAHSLEEGHYVIGPKIEIPVHYEGQFKLLEQDRDVAEPVQYFNSVEEVAKAFPERVYVMEEITFNVKMASGECNEDTEVYNITLSTGDELTLMGQAEILYAKTSRERTRFNTIFKRIGKLNSIIRLSRGKMPCLICMNHRTNESVSLPFQCKGRFSTCSPLELQMQEGEHTIRDIVEKTRLPVNVAVPRGPPRNPHDLHAIREGHRYKLVNAQTRTVVVCCVLRSNKIAPVHFPLHAAPAAAAAMPRVILPEGMLQGELWLDTMVHRWLTFCQEHFDIDDYSRAVRDVRADWGGDDGGGGGGKSHKRSSYNGVPTNTGGGTNGCPAHGHHVPSSLTYARDELTQSFHRLSVCVYGGNLHGNSEVNLQGCVALCRDWALLPSDCLPSGGGEPDYLPPEPPESAAGRPPSPPLPPPPPPPPLRGGVAYEELWLDQLQEQRRREAGRCCRGNRPCPGGEGASLRHGSSSPSAGYPLGPLADRSLSPPPVPPKSEAVKEECRLLNAPPIPPRSSKQTPTMLPALCKTQQQELRSQSPTLSYYSSGLHNIGGCESEATEPEEQSSVCNPCSWIKASEPCPVELCRSLPTDGSASRLSWPNTSSGGGSFRGTEDLVPPGCWSYYSYPRKRPLGSAKTCGATTSLYDFDGREHTCRGVGGGGSDLRLNKAPVNPFGTKSSSYTLETYRDEPAEELNAKQSLSCPVLPPRTPKSNVVKMGRADSPAAETADSPTAGRADSPTMGPADSPIAGRELPPRPLSQQERSPGDAPASVTPSCPPAAPQGQWKPPSSLGGLSIEEVSRSLRFIGLPDDVGALFATEKIDGSLLLQLTEEILAEDFKLSKLQVKKLMQFINGWRPKV